MSLLRAETAPALGVVLFSLAVFVVPTASGQTQPLQSERATVIAPTETRLKLLRFISYNTIESKMMLDQLANDAGVRSLIEQRFVLTTHIEGRDAEQIFRYQVKKFPTTIATTAEGTEIDRLAGFSLPHETIAWLEAAAKGESPMAVLAAKVAAPDATIADRLKFAEAAMRRGKYAEALRELTISLDRSSAPGAKEDRPYLKATLARLATLGSSEPAALELIKTRRDTLEKSLTPHFAEPILLVFSFNEALKQTDRNLALFLRLPAESPLRDRLFPTIFPQLVLHRHYQEAVEGADLENLVNSAYPRKTIKPTSTEETGKEKSRSSHSDHGHQRVLELTTLATEALLGVGHLEKAKRISGRALESYDGKALRTRLQQAAQRAASPAADDFNIWRAAQPPTGADRPATSK